LHIRPCLCFHGLWTRTKSSVDQGILASGSSGCISTFCFFSCLRFHFLLQSRVGFFQTHARPETACHLHPLARSYFACFPRNGVSYCHVHGFPEDGQDHTGVTGLLGVASMSHVGLAWFCSGVSVCVEHLTWNFFLNCTAS